MVNMREVAEEYRLNHWAQVMQERNARGMSIKAFCKSEGIHPNRYFYWQRKLRGATHQSAVTENTPTTQMQQAPHGWALCEAAKTVPEQRTVQIEIGKSRVKVDAGTDQELLANVCRMLMSLC